MPTPDLTEQELVDTLKKTFIPTIVVEGSDDVVVYRYIERQIGPTRVSIFPCGGRSVLLKVFQRRAEFANLNVAFVADKDMWTFTAIPSDYSDVIFTNGYSVENDLYTGSDLEKLLDESQRLAHSQMLKSVIEWFAFEVDKYLSGSEGNVEKHIDEVLASGNTGIDATFLARIGFSPPNVATVAGIAGEYKTKLRGKLLFQLIHRCTRRPGITYSSAQLLDIGLKFGGEHPLIQDLTQRIRQQLSL